MSFSLVDYGNRCPLLNEDLTCECCLSNESCDHRPKRVCSLLCLCLRKLFFISCHHSFLSQAVQSSFLHLFSLVMETKSRLLPFKCIDLLPASHSMGSFRFQSIRASRTARNYGSGLKNSAPHREAMSHFE